MKNGKLARAIRLEPKLKIKDLVIERARKYGLATWCRATKHIDSAFATPDMEFYGARFILFCYGTGGNTDVVVDIPHQYLLG